MPDQLRPPDIPPELWAILSRSSEAVAHHWVPRMLLRNFTQHPEQDDPEIWAQPKRGAPRRSRVGSECVVNRHNTLEGGGSLPSGSVEGVFAQIESDAPPVIRKLRAGDALQPAERMAMSNFIAGHFTRTPRSRFQQTYLAEQLMTQKMLGQLRNDRDAFRERTRTLLQRDGDSEPSDQAIEAFIEAQAEALASGSAKLGAPHNFDAAVGLFGIPEIAPIVYGMAWAGVRTQASEAFVLGDHPVVIHDPAQTKDKPAAWLSSPEIEVTLPLAPNFCLLLIHVTGYVPPYQQASCGASTVDDVNLRTIAHAWRKLLWSDAGGRPSGSSAREDKPQPDRPPCTAPSWTDHRQPSRGLRSSVPTRSLSAVGHSQGQSSRKPKAARVSGSSSIES